MPELPPKGLRHGCPAPSARGGGAPQVARAPAGGGGNRAPATGRPAMPSCRSTSNFTFLRGASHPEELVTTAAALGLRAIAITDRNSLAGVVRAHQAAKTPGCASSSACRLDLADGRACSPIRRTAPPMAGSRGSSPSASAARPRANAISTMPISSPRARGRSWSCCRRSGRG